MILRVKSNRRKSLLVDFNKPESLAKAYLHYYQHPELCSVYGNNAQEVIRARFDSQRVSDEVTTIYKSLI